MMEWNGLTLPSLLNFTGFVPPEGDGSNRVAIIGEAPGEIEAKYSQPFHPNAPAGSVLNRMLSRGGLERRNFVISNACWSRPPGNYLQDAPYEGQALAAYEPFLDKMFELYRPRVIVAMGTTALRVATDFAYGGRKATITNVQGYVLDGKWDGTRVIGCLHPSAIMRGEQRLTGCVIWALQRAVDIARNGFVRLPTRYVTHPSLEDALAFERGYSPEQHFLSYDIETLESSSLDEEEVEEKDEDISYQITRISFCWDGINSHAISLPWQQPYIEIAERILASTGPKRVWNGNFDNPRLTAAGARIGGRNYDSMWAWKFLQPTLPRSLGFVAPFYNWTGEPWKNTSSAEPEAYSCKDAHALQLIADGVDAHLRQKGQWNIYERHVVQLGEVLTQMSKNGLPYDQEKAKAFEVELQAKWDERFADLQQRVPDELKPSKQKAGYKKTPKVLDGLTQREFKVLGTDLTADERELKLALGPLADYDIVSVQRWCLLEPFLPTSTQQVQALLKYHSLPVGKNRKTKRDSADDEHLKKICKRIATVKKHADLLITLNMIRECRQLNKVLGTYVKGWKPGRDGRIHATPGHWGKMFRVSWRRPNISATIQDKTEAYVASGFRKCAAVSSGRILLEADWRGIEAVLVGWFAGDTDYMRLARLGVHSFMASHLLGRPADPAWSDSDLSRYFAEIKNENRATYAEAKATVHGVNFGETPFGLANVNDWMLKRCKYLYDMYFDLFPKIRIWQRSVMDRASRECKLRNPFGYEMPFYEVFRWDSKRQQYTLGEDAKSAIAFLPRDTAAAMLKEVLLRLAWLATDGIMLASTHDSITCECNEADVESIALIVRNEMERSVPELNNLSIGVECKAGKAWHESAMTVLELPALEPAASVAVTLA